MNPPKIYYTQPETLEYIGEGLADFDPMDPNNWLVPAGAYLDAPPAALTGHAIVRTADLTAWTYIEDNRGTVYDTATGAPQEYQTLGPLPAGLTKLPYPGPSYVWSGEAWVLKDELENVRLVVLAQRDERLAEAATRIPPLQDALDLCDATASEQAALLTWKRYRVALNRIELQPGFPLTIEWPTRPDQLAR